MAEVTAYVTEENGEFVLHDPVAEGMIRAIEEHNRQNAQKNCQRVFEESSEAVERFHRRFIETGHSPQQYCLVLIQVDDTFGRPIADALMPEYDWQPIRDIGQEPFARGIADREYIQSVLEIFAPEVAVQLKEAPGVVTVVVASSTAAVFPL